LTICRLILISRLLNGSTRDNTINGVHSVTVLGLLYITWA